MKVIAGMVIAGIGGAMAAWYGAPGWAILIAGWSFVSAVFHVTEKGR